ncbi:MAG: DUF6036 family nucleotidyltransferase [Spirochaetia bacterium]
MTRNQLEHLIRASGSIAGSDTVVVIGSQAILASFPEAPQELLASMEADLYPLDDPRKADVIDGAIGEGSPFHEEFGYYAHGVGPETAVLPPLWTERAVTIQNRNTHGIAAICPSPQDLAVSKLAAGRAKDFEFVRALLRHKLLDKEAVARAVEELPPEQRVAVADRLALIG